MPYCMICGRSKTHYRLYGYRCDNPAHSEMENHLVLESFKTDKEAACHHCQTMNVAGAKFCYRCGKRMPKAENGAGES